jgi:hypothetical protein
MAKVTIWGEGGFDPSKPNNNIIDQYEVADPEPTEQELAKASAMAKLKALGLSDAEVAALLGS